MPLTEQDARRNLEALLTKYATLSEPSNDAEKRAMTEASVVRQFIDVLLRDVLGWPIEDPARYQYELHTLAGRPDMTLTPEKGGMIYVEAKKFGILKPLQKPSKAARQRAITPAQMALAGMATDRTPEEQQAINYAFQNNAEWAILTNFEILRLFNARRDWLVLSFDDPYQYRDDFDLLWQLAYHNVVGGSLEQLSSQRVAPDIDSDYLTFINEWRERLAKNLIKLRFENDWMNDEHGEIDLVKLRGVVQRFLDRLVVARFAEDWLVIRPRSLWKLYEVKRESDYTHTMDEYLDVFFRRFDEDHNSALFAPGLVDGAVFDDATLMQLIEKLYEVRYRAMPADILGNTYEQYLGKALALDNGAVTTRDNLETRKKQGSYYTPQVIVKYLVAQSLGRYLYGTVDGSPDGGAAEGERRKTAAEIRDLRVLDSACGSGSFLIEAYYTLQDFYRAEIVRLTGERNRVIGEMAAQAGGDTLDLEVEARRLANEIDRIQNYPRLILETHLYGVDLDPQAAEVATVNLIMRALERSTGEKRLPLILNQNVKVGNGLIGLRADDPRMAEYAGDLAEIIQLRRRLTTDPDKPDLEALEEERKKEVRERSSHIEDARLRKMYGQELRRARGLEADRLNKTHDALEAKLAALREKLDAEFAPHFGDLSRVRPFHWGLEFPEAFYDDEGVLKDALGFQVIVGNPPWEIVKPDVREYYAQFDADIESKLTRAQVEQRIAEIDAASPKRRAAYEAQTKTIEEAARFYHQSEAFTRQGRGDTATHKLFTERMWDLLSGGGRLGYVVPSGIYTDLGTKDLRQMLLDEGNIQYVYSFSNERFFFSGVHHSFKFCLLGAQKGEAHDGFWATFRFNPRVAVRPDDLSAFLADENNLIYVRKESLRKFSPDSLSLMEFQTRRDYEIAEKIYGDHPLLDAANGHGWNIKLNNEFHYTNDRHRFNQQRRGIPLYEGKMFHQYDAFYGEPQFWIGSDELADISDEQRAQLKQYRVVHRRIARSTDERTLIAAIVPQNTACEVNATVVLISDEAQEHAKLFVCALFNAFVLDYLIRYKVSTTLNMFYIYSLPMPRLTSGDPYFEAIVPRAARLVCTRAAYADLWREVMGSAWDESSGATDPAERQRLRDEIDALVARLYGLTRDELDHILGTFPLVFPDTDAGQAKRARLLATFDATTV